MAEEKLAEVERLTAALLVVVRAIVGWSMVLQVEWRKAGCR